MFRTGIITNLTLQAGQKRSQPEMLNWSYRNPNAPKNNCTRIDYFSVGALIPCKNNKSFGKIDLPFAAILIKKASLPTLYPVKTNNRSPSI